MRNPYEALQRIKEICPNTVAVGSRVTCNPAPQGTDADYLVLVFDHKAKAFYQAIQEDGWNLAGSRIDGGENNVPAQDRFYSYKLGEINLIVTESQCFAHRFLAASSIAKRMNMVHKADRIALFQAVLYGNIDNEFALLPDQEEVLF